MKKFNGYVSIKNSNFAQLFMMALTLDYIKLLTSRHEGVDVEFKETTGQLNRGMETLCGMMNGSGGIVIFGVTNNGHITGQTISDKTTRDVGDALKKFDPSSDVQPQYIELPNGLSLIAFVTDGGDNNRPYLWNGTAYQRHDSVTSVMPREKQIRLYEDQKGLTYGWELEIDSDETHHSIDEQLLRNTIQAALRRGRLSQTASLDSIPTVLNRLRLRTNGSINNAAMVLFGKDFYSYPQSAVRLARFKGTEKRDFIDNQQIEGNIFELLDKVMAFFFKHLCLKGTTHNLTVRQDDLEIPYDALREAVVNALCHRAWQQKSSSVGIAIFDDRVEIENPGRFPAHLSPQRILTDEERRDENTSRPPNPVIANVMFMAGLIEHWGRGLSMMNDICEKSDLPKPRIIDNGFLVKIVFQRPPLFNVSDDNQRSGEGAEKERRRSGEEIRLEISANLLKFIKIIGENWYSAAELRELLGFKSEGSFRRNYINPAREEDLIAFEDPEHPNSRNQRYGLTTKGKRIFYSKG